jgi:DNA-binding response OmpR family regulator
VIAPRVLIVEDDPALARGLSDVLRQHGFDVRVAQDGQTGLDTALGGGVDLIFLDVMLPRINGYEICRMLRAQDVDVPILMLTAKGREQDVVMGLNLGADDYVVKPFRTAELIARAQAFLRRRGADRSVTRFGEFVLDLRSRTLSRNGMPVELTAKEFKLLAYFASRPGCALARDTILNAVWGTTIFVTQRSIDRCVATLRAKVETDPHHPAYIHTIRDIGYRFDPSTQSD